MPAGETIAGFFDWPEVRFARPSLDAEAAAPREGCAIARHPRWKDAIEHIDAAGDQLDHLRRRAEAHRVTRLVRRQERLRHFHLSLIHISEPTRRTPISYAVFCLKK